MQNSVAYVPFCYFEQHTLSLWTEVSSWRPSLMWPLCEKLLLTTCELLAVGDGGETLARVERLAEKQTKLLGAQAVIFQTRRRKKIKIGKIKSGEGEKAAEAHAETAGSTQVECPRCNVAA